MPRNGAGHGRPAEGGFALIEVVVSALIAVLVTGAVVGLLNSTGRAGAQERHRSQAFSIAQEDQARLRAMRISDLNLQQERTVSVGGTDYTVASTGTFIEAGTDNSQSCGSSASADYVKISSEVTWPNMGARQPVIIQSIVSPLSGSLDPSRGKLEIHAVNGQGEPIKGVGLRGTGPGNFSGSTDSSGCAIFANLPAGSYTLTTSLASPYINQDGEPPGPQTVGVSAGTATSVTLQYDLAGSATVSFTTKAYGASSPTPSTANSIVAQNSGMTVPQVIASPGGERTGSFSVTNLFPFSSPISIYAGSCEYNNPNPENQTDPPGEGKYAIANVAVPAGGAAAPKTIQLPPLNLTVKNSNGDPAAGAEVVVTDSFCDIDYELETAQNGRLKDPGFPWSRYSVCASIPVTVTERRYNYYTHRYEYFTTTEPRYATATPTLKDLSPSSSNWPTITISESSRRGDCQ